MRYHPRRHRSDANQEAIVCALRQIGCSVQVLSDGGGCPDLAIGYHGENYLVEVKDGTPLSEEQAHWHETWRGRVWIAESVEDAIAIVTGRGR